MNSLTRLIQIVFLTLLMSPALVKAEIIATIYNCSAPEDTVSEQDVQENSQECVADQEAAEPAETNGDSKG
ncbi:hypothetical protein [Endozoicomonas sp. 4G]|uniref:hypothetical protein n=1 Tax=Endozoicomonas sp. 4G TaxID=2872754 RepID=UPI0020786834|nr:hypothetical protein [Endozoicomonas sp. 4G]